MDVSIVCEMMVLLALVPLHALSAVTVTGS
jgi:hypothetical protein